MTSSSEIQKEIKSVSYWQVFRLIFVLFCLFLTGDAFFRLDGFRYYASFSEFFPSVALVTVLWSILAGFTTLLLWLPSRISEWFCKSMVWKIKAEHVLFFIFVFIFLAVAVWTAKRNIWPYTQTSLHLKLFVVLCVTVAAIFVAVSLRNIFERWMEIVQNRITPLVWLFGIWFVVSVFLVSYYTWIKQADNVVIQEIPHTFFAGKERPNIILVSFDTLTSRDMSLYGYHRETTPFLNKWAKGASLFTRLQAESNFTTPTAASLMTGKRVWTHQSYHVDGSKPDKSDVESLPMLLKRGGYYTMAYIVNPIASAGTLGVSNSFDIAPPAVEFVKSFSWVNSLRGWKSGGILDVFLYRLFKEKIRFHDWYGKIFRTHRVILRKKLINEISANPSGTMVPPEIAFNRFLSDVENIPSQPFFAWVHLNPPHQPYNPPEPFIEMFESSSEKAEIDQERALYDEFIRYCFKQFEDFIAKIGTNGKLRNTVIILSSDHGESFEHDYIGHAGPHLYEQVTHIPLVIKEAGQTEGRIIHDLLEQIDIPPTIIDLAGIPVPSWMEGRSLVPLMRGKSLQPRPAFSMNFEKNPSRGHQITRGTIAVWDGDYKLIHYLEGNKSLLFNLKQDPDELNNLFDKEPEVGQRLLSIIKENLEKANDKIINR